MPAPEESHTHSPSASSAATAGGVVSGISNNEGHAKSDSISAQKPATLTSHTVHKPTQMIPTSYQPNSASQQRSPQQQHQQPGEQRQYTSTYNQNYAAPQQMGTMQPAPSGYMDFQHPQMMQHSYMLPPPQPFHPGMLSGNDQSQRHFDHVSAIDTGKIATGPSAPKRRKKGDQKIAITSTDQDHMNAAAAQQHYQTMAMNSQYQQQQLPPNIRTGLPPQGLPQVAGRPQFSFQALQAQIAASSNAPPKPKSKRGRPRKNPDGIPQNHNSQQRMHGSNKPGSVSLIAPLSGNNNNNNNNNYYYFNHNRFSIFTNTNTSRYEDTRFIPGSVQPESASYNATTSCCQQPRHCSCGRRTNSTYQGW